MAWDGLLTKLGPTLVREVTPHLMQMVAGFGERFRKDTHEMKAAVDAELASVAREHAALTSAVNGQCDHLDALGSAVATVDRKVELLHRAVDALSRQLTSDAAVAAKTHRTSRTLSVLATVFSALACGAAVSLFLLRR